MFDEQPDGDPHGECAAEIHRLESELAEAKRLLYEASRQMPVGYQQLVNGKWEHCSVFVALGFREDLAPGFRAVYAAPVPSSPSIEREVSGEARADGVVGGWREGAEVQCGFCQRIKTMGDGCDRDDCPCSKEKCGHG